MQLNRKKAEQFGLWCDALYKLSLANHVSCPLTGLDSTAGLAGLLLETSVLISASNVMTIANESPVAEFQCSSGRAAIDPFEREFWKKL